MQVSFLSGAAGSRTLVQTSSKTAFYMLSFLLIVGQMTGKKPTYHCRITFVSLLHQRLVKAIPTFMMLRSKRR